MEDTEGLLDELSRVQEDISKLITEDTTTITVKSGSRVKNLSKFAAQKFEDPTVDKIVWTGEGGAISKVISCVEIIKREVKGLYQVTNIFSKKMQDNTKLDATTNPKITSAISILLSKVPIEQNVTQNNTLMFNNSDSKDKDIKQALKRKRKPKNLGPTHGEQKKRKL